MKLIAGRSLEEWEKELPLLKAVEQAQEVFWVNPGLASTVGRTISATLGLADIDEAEKRLERFAPYLAKAFPETRANGGIIESPLTRIPKMKKALELEYGLDMGGELYLKCDGHLPISGSVKARGGIYEVLKTAEDVARANGLISKDGDSAQFDAPKFREVLSAYSIVVGSTGNLGLSIGIMSARLGFRVYVHMSADAKQWKKDLLRSKGAVVIEHAGDYGLAVAAGRRESEKDPKSHFVDDENSITLFLGYAVAAKRLRQQMEEEGLQVNDQNPLFVYLPCGVGGAPGGITFGLRTIFGDNVHCFFAEPTHAPAMLLGLMTGRNHEVSVNDFGLDNQTAADGLAVGRPSGFVGKTLARDISGLLTVSDESLYRLLKLLADTEKIYLEPSALAGFPGPWRLMSSKEGLSYLGGHTKHMARATHVVWATGGGMVPEEIMKGFYDKGLELSK